jgi:hypothetical protein
MTPIQRDEIVIPTKVADGDAAAAILAGFCPEFEPIVSLTRHITSPRPATRLQRPSSASNSATKARDESRDGQGSMPEAAQESGR